MSDFRVVEHEEDLNIRANKEKYIADFKSKHKRATNHYRYVSKAEERDCFGESVYNGKCAYCGVDKTIQGANHYEIDHFLNEANHKFIENINGLDNLIYACRECNQKKRDFIIPDGYIEVLNPDYEKYGFVFERNNACEIIISDKYVNDEVVEAFHERLRLGDQRRRLDFVLMKLEKYLAKLKKEASDESSLGENYWVILSKYNFLRDERNRKIF